MTAARTRFTLLFPLILLATIAQADDTAVLPEMAAVEQAYQQGDFVFVRKSLETLATKEGSALAQYRFGRVLFEGLGGPQDAAAAIGWLEKAAAQNHPEAATLLARIYLSAGPQRDPERAADLLANAAARGGAEAQYYLGLLHLSGAGVQQDAGKAFNWFLAASEAGNPAAQYELSKAYSRGQGTGQNTSEALRWLQEAAAGGHADAQYFLANALDTGQGAAKSRSLALDWYRRAAEGGQVLAQRTLGTYYLQGLNGLEPNAAEALKWLGAAAEAGDPGAMNNLAIGYASGTVLPRDDARAFQWYERASELGLGRSTFALGLMREAGRGVTADFARAVAHYAEAADQGEARAAVHLGKLAGTGALDGVVAPHDAVPWAMQAATEAGDAEAMAWVEAQAAIGLRPAQVALGLWYLEQEGQTDAAIALLQEAATAGSVAAQARLGALYTTGEGVTLDYVTAHKWLNIAAASGHRDAAATRDLINELMTPEQVAEAQTAARVFFDGAAARAPQTGQVVLGPDASAPTADQ